MNRTERAIALLRALQIEQVEYSLNGGGDSGETTLERVVCRDGRVLAALPNIPVGITAEGAVESLDHLLDDIAGDLPEGDWVNNEGGYGTVIIRPFENGDELRFQCEMTFREEGDYGDDDDEGFVDNDPDDDEDDPDDGSPSPPTVVRTEEAVR